MVYLSPNSKDITESISSQKQLHIRIPKDIYTRLKVKCAYEDISMQDYIVKLLAEDMGARSEQQISVLIVDDETIVRESLRDWLKDVYQVTTAASGEEALDLIKKNNFDIVIIDVRLSGKNGLQVLREVKEIKPHIKSIVITAYPSVELAVEAMREGAVDYIVKPLASEQLEKLIWETINKCRKAT